MAFKARVILSGDIVEVSCLFNSEGFFKGFEDVKSMKGEKLIWPAELLEPLEPIEPNWGAVKIRFAETALKEIIRYDQGANSPEDSADLAMNYANALVEKLKEQFKKEHEEDNN